MKLTVLLLITLVSIGSATVIPLDMSDPAPGPLEFIASSSIWRSQNDRALSLPDFSVEAAAPALNAISTVEICSAFGPISATLSFDDPAGTLLSGHKDSPDDPKSTMLSGLSFLLFAPAGSNGL